MGTLKLTYTKDEESDDYCLTPSDFHKFNSSILDLDDISQDGKYFEALAAIFDLEGFTSFCNQIDPHLVIPEYLNEFFDWLFKSISREFVQQTNEERVILWSQFPFFAKFMGDGVLFLWDTKDLAHNEIGNIVVSLRMMCDDYVKTFLPHINRSVTKPPAKLRCGIARGQIISIGEEKDFVGPCINVAARIQKLGQFSFAFPRRGFQLENCFNESRAEEFMLVRMPIRGVGDEELLFVLRREYDLLSPEEKEQLSST